MRNYRKKPVVIEAQQFTGDIESIPADCPIETYFNTSEDIEVGYGIATLEGVMFLKEGDWIIKGVKGEYYPCKPDIFEMTYEEV